MEDKKYCIYRHLKPNGEVFYIGIGNIKRPYERRHHNNLWDKVIKKHPNYEIQVLKKNATLEEVKDLEIILISYYGRKCDKTGNLCNLSLGGEGAFGFKHSKESKDKMSKSRQGFVPWNKNKILTDEHKLKLLQNSGQAKKVINILTLEIYSSGAVCAKENNYNYVTLQQQLSGIRKNKTNFKFLKNYYYESL